MHLVSAVSALLFVGLSPAFAEGGLAPTDALPPLQGEVILSVTGLDTALFPDGKVEFDQARLQAIGESTILTSTIWTEGVHEFSGVSLKDFLGFLGLQEGVIRGVALNEYAVEIPVSDGTEDGPILAYAIDDVPMSVRDKGPIWLVYPYDHKSEYRSEVIYSRSIWQLSRIEANR